MEHLLFNHNKIHQMMRRNEYYIQVRKPKPDTSANYEKKRREKPITSARDLLRMKLRCNQIREYETFKQSMPHFLTI